MTVKVVPEGWHTVTPRLFAADAARLVDFLKHAFGASGSFRPDGPSEIHIGDSIVMVSEAGVREAMPAFLYLYLDDVDAAYQRALELGATLIEEPKNMFYGDRRATVRDPFGNIWQITTHQEDLTLEELRHRRAGSTRQETTFKEHSMPAKVNPTPAGASAVTPYLSVSNAAQMIEFYKKVFGAVETMRLEQPDGRIGHAELKINGAAIMLADEFPEIGLLSPKTLGGTRSPVFIHLYVENVDEVYKRALSAGATSLREPADQFYGERNAQVPDPSGHCWDISIQIEEVSLEEMQKRFNAMVNPS
jgi:PhnB protein